jgi:hypothetical protein
MPPDYFVIHSKYEKLIKKKINDYDIYDKIVDGLINMEIFCITCCIKQTNIICINSNIQIKDYSVGYIHKFENT